MSNDYTVLKCEGKPSLGLIPLRKKHPKLAKAADFGNPGAAIRLFCLQCMGGCESEVKRCSAPRCPLHRHRLTNES